jgi:hypothetical protein
MDPLGLAYPNIRLRAPNGFLVTSVCLRSVFQYMIIETSNVVEVSIYRTWDSFNTKRTPLMEAGVSIFNQDWDDQMESVENHTEPRNWHPQLENFFGREGAGQTDKGIKGLFKQVRTVQEMLVEAAKAIPRPPTPPEEDDLYD